MSLSTCCLVCSNGLPGDECGVCQLFVYATHIRYVHITFAKHFAQSVRMYVCMYVCMYVRMYVCTHVCMYVRMYVCVYVNSIMLHTRMHFVHHVPVYSILVVPTPIPGIWDFTRT